MIKKFEIFWKSLFYLIKCGWHVIRKLLDMWQNYEFLKYYVIFIFFKQLSLPCLAVSALYFKKHIWNRFREYSKIRNFVTYQITFLLTCQPHKYNKNLIKKAQILISLLYLDSKKKVRIKPISMHSGAAKCKMGRSTRKMQFHLNLGSIVATSSMPHTMIR